MAKNKCDHRYGFKRLRPKLSGKKRNAMACTSIQIGTKTKTTMSKALKIVGWRGPPNSLILETLGPIQIGTLLVMN